MSNRQQCISFNGMKRHLIRGDLHSWFMGEHKLSDNDICRVADAYCRLYLMSLDIGQQISEFLDSESARMFRRNCSEKALYQRIVAFASVDTAYIFKQFKNALQALRHLPDNGKPHWGRGASRHDCNRWLSRYVKSYDVDTRGVVWSFIQPYFSLHLLVEVKETFIWLNDLLQYISRLTLQDVDWIEEENIEDYVAFEERLHNLTYDPDTVAGLATIITDWFKDFTYESLWVDHGYGATAEVKRSKGTAAKYHAMIPTLETAFVAQRLDWTPHTDIAWKGLTSSYEDIVQRYLAGEQVLRASDMVCKVQLVPKGCDKKRVVSKEPTCHQFYQKMIGSAMSVHFDRHPQMKINLHNQELNRQFAAIGSKWRDYATIDLSSASDSVTFTLFKKVFYNTPLYDLIIHCRTTKAELEDGRIVELEKMSPMGSAVCFPIECTIFSAIVALANKRLGVHTDYRVYGDDLVVHAEVYDEVIRLLNELNFLVNEDKSFPPEAPFKESCGIECFDGANVEPIRLSRKYDCVAALHDREVLWNSDYFGSRNGRSKRRNRNNKISLQLDSLYKHGNDAFYRGYDRLRMSYIHDALYIYKAPVFSHNERHGFLTTATNICIPNAREQYFSDYLYDCRRKGLYVRVLATRATINRGEEQQCYSKLLEEYDRTNRLTLLLPEDRIECKAGSAQTYYRWVWVPKADLDAYI